jgi:hypothetical protein
MRRVEKFELGLFAVSMLFILAYLVLSVVDPERLHAWLS